MKPRSTLLQIAAAFALLAFSVLACAQSYPNRPVRIIVPYAAGGLPDLAARVLAQQFSAQLGQPFTVENLPGSSGMAGINAVLSAAADGHTLLSADPGHWAINPAMNPKLPYDPQRDFVPVGLFAENAPFFLVVNDAVPARSLLELVALARAQPGVLSYASAGVGSHHHLIMEDFKAGLGLDILHVPYKGSAQAVPALLGGQVSMAIAAMTVVSAYAKDGRVRLLGVSTKARSSIAPQVPPMANAGIPDFDHGGALGLLARAGTPTAVLDTLAAALARTVAMPDVAARLEALGLEPLADASPAALAARIRQDRLKYNRIVKNLGPEIH